MYGYIYKTTNLINGKIYVGQKKSNKFIKKYFGSGVLIKRAIDKYGTEKFKVEMIDFANSADELDSLEVFYIDELKAKHIFGNYNIADGGFLPRYDINNQPEWRQREIKRKMSHSLKRRGNINLVNGIPNRRGVKLTSEHKEKLREAKLGKILPDEQKQKMSDSHKKLVQGREKEFAQRFKGKHDNRKQPVEVYEKGVFICDFPSIKECTKYFSDLGLGKRTVVNNLNNHIPICPNEKPKTMSHNIYKKRIEFKDYKFIYKEIKEGD